MEPIVVAAGSALVGAMAADTWLAARSAIVGLWRRVRPLDEPEELQRDLDDLHAEILEARGAGDVEMEQALIGAWQLRLQKLLGTDSTVLDELDRVVRADLLPTLSSSDQSQIGAIVMTANARGHARVFQAGRDQHINES